jgi:hypothetical protein
MTMPEQTVCEVCHERRATHFVCYGGTRKSSHLCDECFGTSVPPEVRQFATATREAHCQYCGGQPCAGGIDFLALMTGVQQMKYMCMPCSMEYNRYIQQQLQQEDSGLSQQEQLAALRTLNIAADKHMKQWVSERDSQ